jgi:hypothetical protein
VCAFRLGMRFAFLYLGIPLTTGSRSARELGNREKKNSTRKKTNSSFATAASATAMPVKLKTPAISATTSNTTTHLINASANVSVRATHLCEEFLPLRPLPLASSKAPFHFRDNPRVGVDRYANSGNKAQEGRFFSERIETRVDVDPH